MKKSIEWNIGRPGFTEQPAHRNDGIRFAQRFRCGGQNDRP